jgi:heptosyltransferase I
VTRDCRYTAGMREPRRILLIKPSSLGDIIHALPVLAGLRARYPAAHIAWLAGTAFAPLLAGHPLLDEVIPFDRRAYGRMGRSATQVRAFVGFVRALRARRFDLVLDLQGLFRSGFLAWISGAPRRIGFADARELAWAFYTERVRTPRRCERDASSAVAPLNPAIPQSLDPAIHAVDKNLFLARRLGLPVDPPQFALGLTPAEHAAAAARVASVVGGAPAERAVVAVVVGARWESKLWPDERLAELVARLPEACGLPVVLLGGPEERARAAAVCAAVAPPPANLVGQTTLRELCAVLGQAALVISQDSGPMHIAAALGRPLVAIFGPTSPARTGPYSAAARVVTRGLPCAPCFARRCPLGHHACLRELPAADVLAAARAALAQPAPRDGRSPLTPAHVL